MTKLLRQICVLSLFCILALRMECILAQDHSAHTHIHSHTAHPVLSAIEQEVRIGTISEAEALLQSIYAGFQPERLDPRFHIHTDAPIKCLTPVLMEYERLKDELNPAVVAEIEQITSPKTSATTQSHLSPSGNFILYYETEGEDAVPLEDIDENGIPDYVEKTAFAADSSYRYEVSQLGFRDFLKSDPYEIYFQNFGLYGRADASGSTTFITIHNNFEGFPGNTHSEGNQTGAIYATVAHEIKHAIQYATNRWQGEAGSFAWSEMDAVLMEEVVFDDVNDYYNYIKNSLDGIDPSGSSIFGNPNNPIPGSYNHVSWALYFHEMYGSEFWVQVWEQFFEERELPYLDAVDRVLTSNNHTLAQEHLVNHIWHMTAGPGLSTPDFGFSERLEYPNSRFDHTLFQLPDSLTNRFLQQRAASYIDVVPSNITPGQPAIHLNSTVNGMGIGVIAYFRDGTVEVQYIVDPNSSSQSLQTTWSWSDITDMRIAVVNTNRDSSGTYNLTVTSTLPEEDIITQNYPNPFNPTTNIQFALNEPKDVKIEVYDRIGRKISTLVDDRLNRGFHNVRFDGSRFASGVYFYRIITDQTVTTKKMVLVK